MDFSGIDTLELLRPQVWRHLRESGVLLKRSRMPLEPQMNERCQHDPVPQRHACTRSGEPRQRWALERACGELKTAKRPFSATARGCGKPLRRVSRGAYQQPEHAPAYPSIWASRMRRAPYFRARCPKKACAYRSNPPLGRPDFPPGRCSPSAATGAMRCSRGTSA